jgi:hypothetical protein
MGWWDEDGDEANNFTKDAYDLEGGSITLTNSDVVRTQTTFDHNIYMKKNPTSR